MKIKRKELTNEQKLKICGYRSTCFECPMAYGEGYSPCVTVISTEAKIKKYWNEEIEIKEV